MLKLSETCIDRNLILQQRKALKTCSKKKQTRPLHSDCKINDFDTFKNTQKDVPVG
jgi:hypothetical protein